MRHLIFPYALRSPENVILRCHSISWFIRCKATSYFQ